MIERNTRTSVLEEEKVNLETPLLTDMQLDGCICPGFDIFSPWAQVAKEILLYFGATAGKQKAVR